MSLVSGLALLVEVVLVWILGTHIAWMLNRANLREYYSEVPYNWRVMTWIYGYPRWLKEYNKQLREKESNNNEA